MPTSSFPSRRTGVEGPDAPSAGQGEPVVELLAWPADVDRRSVLAATGRPRLLLVDPEAPPPIAWDDLEDWVRLPGATGEIEARAQVVAARARARGIDPRVPSRSATPIVDADGVLRFRGQLVILPPIEARLLAAMLGTLGGLVPREELFRAGWPTGTPRDQVLRRRIGLLRRRVHPLGVRIDTVRGQGYITSID